MRLKRTHMYSMCSKPRELGDPLQRESVSRRSWRIFLSWTRRISDCGERPMHWRNLRSIWLREGVRVLQHLVHRNAVARPFPDEAERRRHVAVLHGQDIRGVPGHDAERTTRWSYDFGLIPARSRRAGPQRGTPTEGVGRNAREGGIRELAPDGGRCWRRARRPPRAPAGPRRGPR